MKYKYVAAILSLTLCTSALAMTGCNAKSSEASTSTEGQVVYGEVTKVGTDSVTIKVGTMADDSDGDNNSDSSSNSDSDSNSDSSGSDDSKSDDPTSEDSESDDSKSEDSKQQQQPQTVSLDLTGEKQTITVDDGTEITRENNGGPGGAMPGGEAPSGEAPSGEAPAKPDGDSSDGNAPSGEVPEKPDGDSSDGNAPGGEAPAKPDGDNSDGNAPSGEAPAKPEDSNNGNASSDSADSLSGDTSDASGTDSSSTDSSNTDTSENGAPEKPDGDGQTEDLELSDLSKGDIVSIELDADGNAEEIKVLSGTGAGGMGGQSQGVESYDAVNEYTEDTEVKGETVESTGTDENAIHAYEGAEVTLKDMTISRKSSDSTGGDNSSFYGVGAAVLDTDGTTYISNSTIDTDAKGAAGAFAYGDGTVYIADTEITTAQDTSGGIHAAGGGTLYAWDVTATTQGESSAAIRSDRGGGTMVVDGGTYTSNGTGSPAIYSTADISVNDATLTANGSEAICIEGLNTIRLFDCDLTGNMSDLDQNDCTWNVILYQSMSGDSEVGNSTFEMDGGSLTAKNGGMFYTTNTESTFVLSDVDITNAENAEFFLRCTGNNNQRGWGTSGSNGADCHFTGIKQEMEGNVIWDSISQLDFYMTDGSTLTGAVVQDDTYANGGSGGYCNLYIDKNSTWVVTGDSTLTSLDAAGKIVDADGNTVTIKGSDGTVYVKGTSQYTVTVDSYSDKGDVSGASTTSSWSDYEVEKPSQLK